MRSQFTLNLKLTDELKVIWSKNLSCYAIVTCKMDTTHAGITSSWLVITNHKHPQTIGHRVIIYHYSMVYTRTQGMVIGVRPFPPHQSFHEISGELLNIMFL